MSTLATVHTCLGKDWDDLQSLLAQKLQSPISKIGEVGHYLLQSGGKRIRPILHLLAARALGVTGIAPLQLAVVLEYIHTATLLHDDVVDKSLLRRGASTAHAVWGDSTSILVGDFLYSRAFELLVELGQMPIMAVLAHTTNQIAEGEVLQLELQFKTDIKFETYQEVIRRKTAILFEAATTLAGILTGAPTVTMEALRVFGSNFGIAYQWIDDVMDYSASAEVSGKHLGDDLAEGKLTYPVLYALWHATEGEKAMVETAFQTGDRTAITKIQALLKRTQACEYVREQALTLMNEAQSQLSHLPQNAYCEQLWLLGELMKQRNT